MSNSILQPVPSVGDRSFADCKAIETPEIKLLFACIPGSWSDVHHEVVYEAADRVTSWDSVLNLAARHRMVPQTAWALKQTCATIPTGTQKILEHQYYQCIRAGLVMKRELRRLGEALAEADIPLAVLKGPAVEQQVYAETQLRQYKDLDILVQADQLFDACRVLNSLGYKGQIELACGLPSRDARRLQKHYRHLKGCISFAGMPIDVELHWNISSSPKRNALFEDELWSRPADVPLAGVNLRAITGADLLIYLAHHGGNHRWKRLSWLCDFARAVELAHELDFDQVFLRAEQLTLRPYLELGLTMLAVLVPQSLQVRGGASTIHCQSDVAAAVSRSCHAIIADDDYYENRLPLSTLQWLFELRHTNAERLRTLSSMLRPNDKDLLKSGWWGAHYRRLTRASRRLFRRNSEAT